MRLYVRYLQHAGVDVPSALVDGGVDLVVSVSPGGQVSGIGAKEPLELGSGVSLHTAHHFSRVAQVVRYLVRRVHNNRLIYREKVR